MSVGYAPNYSRAADGVVRDRTGYEIGCRAMLFLSALALRMLYWHCNPILSRDGIFYIAAMGQLEHGRQIPEALSTMPPLFFILVRGLVVCGIPAASAGVILNIVVGSLIPISVFDIFRRMKASV